MYGKTSAIGLSKSRLCQNQGSISSLLSGKNMIEDCFLHYLGYFWQETGRNHRSKGQNQNLKCPVSHTRSWSTSYKKNVSSTLQFWGYRSQTTFQKNVKLHFEVWLLFLLFHAYIFENKSVRYHLVNTELIGTNFKSQKLKSKNCLSFSNCPFSF